jgi:hypothetical protein
MYKPEVLGISYLMHGNCSVCGLEYTKCSTATAIMILPNHIILHYNNSALYYHNFII